jgi:hypothetical protein
MSAPSQQAHEACPPHALQRAADDLAGRPVRLAPEGFSSGTVVLQSAAQHDSGRIVEPPERLALQAKAGRCVMRHLPSGREQELAPGCCHLHGEPAAAAAR